MDKKSKIYVAGHRGLVGSAITRFLQDKGFNNLVLPDSSIGFGQSGPGRGVFQKGATRICVSGSRQSGWNYGQ
ncbi:NAD-dependent epimerase/dehydratase family protein [Geofilum rubicundum]|uniref:NAD-dependent epimerase/dehydratase family protein n=1 Tax=Geofilum rubicundum TaxID=472113 RepID=UPI000AA0C9A5|nr:NAD-dependent epimerase/dehydratase family protein [Geofilum rubicundum]